MSLKDPFESLIADITAIKQADTASRQDTVEHYGDSRPPIFDLSNEAVLDKEAPRLSWPTDVLKQELILARESQLEILWLKAEAEDKCVIARYALERDILLRFSKQGYLDILEDICQPIEDHFGIGTVDRLDTASRSDDPCIRKMKPIDQAAIAKCYDLIDSISRRLTKALGYTEYKSINNPNLTYRGPIKE